MKRIFENKELHKQFENYLAKTYQPFLSDVVKLSNQECWIEVSHDQYGNAHLWCNYAPKDGNINGYVNHHYGVPSKVLLEWFLEFKKQIRQKKLENILK